MRRDAVRHVATAIARSLPQERRRTTLSAWWSLDPSDPRFSELPSDLTALMQTHDEPPDPGAALCLSLLIIAMERSLRGVKNEYLSERLRLLGHDVEIEGEAEPLERCPCCDFRTLESRGAYLICSVCYWEDEGDIPAHWKGGANRVSLSEARRNFIQFGACERSAVSRVDPDGPRKFSK